MKIGLIGYGYWGKIIRKYLDSAENIELIAIYDNNINKDNLFVDSIDKIMLDRQIEAIFVCTPTSTHYNICKRALECKKHVFCEKPLTLQYEETRELYRIAIENNRVLYTDYIYTDSISINKIKENIKDIGKVKCIEGSIEQFGAFYKKEDVFQIIGLHLIAAVIHIFDEKGKISSIEYEKIILNKENKCVTGKAKFFLDDIQVSINCDLLSPNKVRTLKVIGDRGVITFDMMNNPNIKLLQHEQSEGKYSIINQKEWTCDEKNNLKIAIEKFVKYIEKKNIVSNNLLAQQVTYILNYEKGEENESI